MLGVVVVVLRGAPGWARGGSSAASDLYKGQCVGSASRRRRACRLERISTLGLVRSRNADPILDGLLRQRPIHERFEMELRQYVRGGRDRPGRHRATQSLLFHFFL